MELPPALLELGASGADPKLASFGKGTPLSPILWECDHRGFPVPGQVHRSDVGQLLRRQDEMSTNGTYREQPDTIRPSPGLDLTLRRLKPQRTARLSSSVWAARLSCMRRPNPPGICVPCSHAVRPRRDRVPSNRWAEQIHQSVSACNRYSYWSPCRIRGPRWTRPSASTKLSADRHEPSCEDPFLHASCGPPVSAEGLLQRLRDMCGRLTVDAISRFDFAKAEHAVTFQCDWSLATRIGSEPFPNRQCLERTLVKRRRALGCLNSSTDPMPMRRSLLTARYFVSASLW